MKDVRAVINGLDIVNQFQLPDVPLIGDSVAIYSADLSEYVVLKVTDRIWFADEDEVELLCDVNNDTGHDLLTECGFG